MKKFTLILLATLIASTTAQAQCYTQAEAEAEQGIRIHSELMVIGLNCTHMGARLGMNLYGDYRSFTARHGELFAKYDNTMKSFFARRGDKNPERSLNTLRTGFANKISKDAASVRPDVFCANNVERMQAAKSMDAQQVSEWAGTFYPSHPVKYAMCNG